MTQSRKQALFVVGVFGLAAILRFWAIGSKPGYEWDEPVYTNIAAHLAHFGVLQVKPDFGSPVEPYMFHPPFYFVLMSGWFKLVGAGITSARIWAALMSLVTLVLTYLFMRRYLGRAAVIPLILLATDGWLVYCGRISWMENTLMVIVVAAMWVYATALDTGSRNRFLAAGLLVGFAAIFKHVGAYLIAAVLVHWFIVRKSTYNRWHLQLFSVVGAVIVLYLIGMTVIFGHPYWVATNIQFERTFGIHGSSTGSVNSPDGFIKPTINTYYIFYATIVLALGSVGLVVRRVVQSIRQRSLDVVRSNSLLFAWSFASLVCFGAISLHFPQYSLLVLWPLYLFASVEAVRFVRTRSPSWQTAMVVGLVVIVALNVVTYYQRIQSRHDNVLASVARYDEEHILPHSLIITEEAVGDIISQPYCKLDHVKICKYHSQYVILYESFSERHPKRARFESLIKRSRRLAEFVGFKDTVTIYRVDKRLNSDAYPRYREHNEAIRLAQEKEK